MFEANNVSVVTTYFESSIHFEGINVEANLELVDERGSEMLLLVSN